jgi:hypothetical protein
MHQRRRDLDAAATQQALARPALPPDVAALAARYRLKCFHEDGLWGSTGRSRSWRGRRSRSLHEIESIFRDTAQ